MHRVSSQRPDISIYNLLKGLVWCSRSGFLDASPTNGRTLDKKKHIFKSTGNLQNIHGLRLFFFFVVIFCEYFFFFFLIVTNLLCLYYILTLYTISFISFRPIFDPTRLLQIYQESIITMSSYIGLVCTTSNDVFKYLYIIK